IVPLQTLWLSAYRVYALAVVGVYQFLGPGAGSAHRALLVQRLLRAANARDDAEARTVLFRFSDGQQRQPPSPVCELALRFCRRTAAEGPLQHHIAGRTLPFQR